MIAFIKRIIIRPFVSKKMWALRKKLKASYEELDFSKARLDQAYDFRPNDHDRIGERSKDLLMKIIAHVDAQREFDAQKELEMPKMKRFGQLFSIFKRAPEFLAQNNQVTKEYMSHLMGNTLVGELHKDDVLGIPIVRKSVGPVEVTIHEKGIRMVALGAMLRGDIVECYAKPGWVNTEKIIDVGVS